MEMPNINKTNDLIQIIKEQLKNQLDKDFDEYKNKCLQDLNASLELKRNSYITEVLNSINIYLENNSPYTLEPNILIKIEKKIIVKE